MGSSPKRQGKSGFRRRRGMLAAAVGAVTLSLVAGACSSSGSSGSSSGTPVKGGTAVMAEFPSSPPNYAFPFMNSTYASNSNIFDLQWLMYRPLYWFGTGALPTLNLVRGARLDYLAAAIRRAVVAAAAIADNRD